MLFLSVRTYFIPRLSHFPASRAFITNYSSKMQLLLSKFTATMAFGECPSSMVTVAGWWVCACLLACLPLCVLVCWLFPRLNFQSLGSRRPKELVAIVLVFRWCRVQSRSCAALLGVTGIPGRRHESESESADAAVVVIVGVIAVFVCCC